MIRPAHDKTLVGGATLLTTSRIKEEAPSNPLTLMGPNLLDAIHDLPTSKTVKRRPGCETNPAGAETTTEELQPSETSGKSLLEHPSPPFLELRPTNPLRPADWRWHTAKHLATTRAKWAWRRADDGVRAAHRFQRQLVRYRSLRTLTKLQAGPPPMSDQLSALLLWRENDSRRHEIEARLLAKQPLADIGNRLATTCGAIRWYKEWFFDFRDHPDLMAATVFPLHDQACEEATLIYRVWKLAGYYGGADVLDVLINTDLAAAKTASATRFFAESIRLVLSRNAFLGLLMVDVTKPAKAKRLLKAYLRSIRLERLEQECVVRSTTIRDALNAHFDSLKAIYGKAS